MRTAKTLRLLLASTALVAGAAVLSAPAAAQTTTASARGVVRDAGGAPVAGATVVAVNVGTNQTFRATTDAGGRYVLNGLRPASYDVTITGPGGQTFQQRVTVAIGQSATLNATLGESAPPEGAAVETPEAAASDDIVVTGTRLVETRTSEVATNVSLEQIRTLPQTDRNFLSFTRLAPGVVYNDSETDKTIRSGASTASAVNVFIDGVSLKNQVLESGIAGQQNSRGNPFGQLAVQEFRVLTQNYKAEYEQAAAAIVTAVTKSGTNEFHGEVFGQYTDKGLSSTDFITKRENREKPDFKRIQYGVSLGGPIIKDRLFFFAAYEGNDQDRAFNVQGNRDTLVRQRFEAASGRQLSEFEGNFVSPFRGDFYFGKLTFTPDNAQVFDASFSRREETDIQGPGGQNAASTAENKINRIDTYNFKWTYTGDSFINEFAGSVLNYNFNPTALNDEPTFSYEGVITFGGKDSTRQYVQNSYILRNDTTFTGLEGHTIKGGVRIGIQDYEADDRRFPQPRFLFRENNNNTPNTTADDTNFTFPAEALLGLGNPIIRASNSQFGIYVQDDWQITDRLELNLGLRWDYEDNMFNNKYVTPPNAAAALRALPSTDYFDPEDYITDGSDRNPRTDMFQPRIGFSYDLFDDNSTVAFGGYGRYYDRNVFINTLDEQYRQQYTIGTFRFSRDGSNRFPSVDAAQNPIPGTGLPTVVFDPRYLTREGLLQLQATATTGLPELFAVKNNAKAPRTDQFSLGVRQRLGVFQAALTGTYIKGNDGYTHLFATRNTNGNCCNTGPVAPFGYANVLIGTDGLETRYKAIYFTLDKNYTQASGWGLNVAYTLSKAEQNGNDLFSLDKVTPEDYGFRPRPGDQRHLLVLSGIVDLPLGFKLSTLTTLGSGQAYQVFDATQGFDVDQTQIYSRYPQKNCIDGVFAFCEVNLTLENRFRLFGDREVSLAVDLFNAFNTKNPTGFDGFVNRGPVFPDGDPLDAANSSTASGFLTLPRRVQFRVGYRF